MLIKRLSRISVPIAVGLAVVVLLLAALSAQADGPVIDTQSSNAAISTLFGETPDAKTGHAIASEISTAMATRIWSWALPTPI